ncbi:hypothetical protein ACFE04_003085 [Oxalis oulophora]
MSGESSYNMPPDIGNTSVMVVDLRYCGASAMDIFIVKNLLKVTEGNFSVTDVMGNVLFEIKGKFFSLRDRRVLVDASGHPIVSLKQKILTAHSRWEVYRGDSNDPKDLLCSVRKSSMLQLKTVLDVFLVGNKEEHACDFRVKGSWLERACTIFQGNSDSVVIAQMQKQHKLQSAMLDKDYFQVTIYPNVDYAFVVALVTILYEICEDKHGD